MKVSNENIIYIYLKTKSEIIGLDQRIKELNIFVEERNKQMEQQFASGELKGEFKVIQALSKMAGQDLSMDDIRKMNQEKMEMFRNSTQKEFQFALKTKVSIIKELQLAFDVLKEEMPEIVEKYTKHLLSEVPVS